ncbi:sensor histidine kinase [Frateuria aurantia]
MPTTSRDTPSGQDTGWDRPGMVAFWALWVMFWLLMISVSIGNEFHNPRARWWEPVLWEGSSALVSTVWMALAVHVRALQADKLQQPRRWFISYLRWLPLIFVSWIMAVYGIRAGVYMLLGRVYEHPGWGFVFVYESIKLTIFAGLWLGVLFGVDSYGQWQLQQYRLLQTRKLLAEAQLAQLQSQLRPHFLFNALNTISALMHTDVLRADRMLAALGDLLRISLRGREGELTRLSDELQVLALYADIMCERYQDRITLTWEVDQACLEERVPTWILQPLLENAFKHAVERTVGKVAIWIGAWADDEDLYLVVGNSGSRLQPDHRDGTGLNNCRERLEIIYGPRASMQVVQEADGVEARLSVPRSQDFQ